MTSEPVGVEPMVENWQSSELVRAALLREREVIDRAIYAAVRATGRGLGRDLLRQRAEEVVAESACQALEHPDSYDPDRPIVAWLVGIAKNVLRSEFRVESRRPARVEFDEAAWGGVLGVIDPQIRAAIHHLEIAEMLARLSTRDRQAIESRYLQELDGDQLADALGVPSHGAARARVHRALQTLRNLFASDGPEVDR